MIWRSPALHLKCMQKMRNYAIQTRWKCIQSCWCFAHKVHWVPLVLEFMFSVVQELSFLRSKKKLWSFLRRWQRQSTAFGIKSNLQTKIKFCKFILFLSSLSCEMISYIITVHIRADLFQWTCETDFCVTTNFRDIFRLYQRLFRWLYWETCWICLMENFSISFMINQI